MTTTTHFLSFAEVEALCLLVEEFNAASADAGNVAADRREWATYLADRAYFGEAA